MPETEEMQVRSLSWQDPLEKKMATHSGILAWKIKGAWWATVHGVAESDMTELHTQSLIDFYSLLGWKEFLEPLP